MSNESPSRACLADFGLMMMVLDPGESMCRNTRSEGGTGDTEVFMSPELLLPSKFGFT